MIMSQAAVNSLSPQKRQVFDLEERIFIRCAVDCYLRTLRECETKDPDEFTSMIATGEKLVNRFDKDLLKHI